MENQTIVFPQRKIKKSYRSVTGHFPSIKNNCNVAYESVLEKKLFLTLEFNKEVQSYIEQPQLNIQHNGAPKVYSADCFVKYHSFSKNKDAIVEVKYTSELEKKKDELQAKFNNINKAVEKLGMDFILFTDRSFSEIYINNLDFLYRYKQQKVTTVYDEQILKSVTEQPISALDLANSLANTKQEYFQMANSIWSLVMQEKISTDLNKEEVTMNTLIWRNDECDTI